MEDIDLEELEELVEELDNNELPSYGEESEPVVVEKKKRGRKPKDKIYFGEKQELAVGEYVLLSNTLKMYGMIKCEDDDLEKIGDYYIKERLSQDDLMYLINKRNAIYEDVLSTPFKKMVEAIIRGKNLYIPNEDFDETYTDTLAHLVEQADKFKPAMGKKAFSYYSNLCKNYLIAKRQKYQRMMIRNIPYDTMEYEFSSDIKYTNASLDKGSKIAKEEVKLLVEHIQKMIDNPDEYDMKDTEIKIGKALINLFENWDYVLSTKGSDKLIKSVVLLFLREETGLDTKGIRDNLKKFKKEFLLIKDFVIS